MVFISRWILLYSSLNLIQFSKVSLQTHLQGFVHEFELNLKLSFFSLRIYTEIFLSAYLTIKLASHKMWTKSGGSYIFWRPVVILVCLQYLYTQPLPEVQTLFDLQLWSKKTHHLTAEMSWTRIFLVDETDPSEVCLKVISIKTAAGQWVNICSWCVVSARRTWAVWL